MSHKSHQRDAEDDVENVDQSDLCEYDFVECSKSFHKSQKTFLNNKTEEEQKEELESSEAFRNTWSYNQNGNDKAPTRYNDHGKEDLDVDPAKLF